MTLQDTQREFLRKIIDQEIYLRSNMYLDTKSRRRIITIHKDGVYTNEDKKILNTLRESYKRGELK